MENGITDEMSRRLRVSHLVDELDTTLKVLSIDENERQFIWDTAEEIRKIHEDTWMHCVRVGLTCSTMAKYKRLKDPKGLVYPATLHDIGKTAVELDLLYKKVGFSEDDRENMKKHISAGFVYLVAHNHPFTAEVVKRHHQIGDHFYDVGPIFSFESDAVSEYLVGYYASLLNMADFHDAMMSRENDRNSPGVPRRVTAEEGREIMLAHYQKHAPGQAKLIREFYDVGIFGNLRGME